MVCCETTNHVHCECKLNVRLGLAQKVEFADHLLIQSLVHLWSLYPGPCPSFASLGLLQGCSHEAQIQRALSVRICAEW